MLNQHENFGLSKTAAGHSYDCAMLNLPPELSKKIIAFGETIPESDLRSGKPEDRETEPHITIGYGMEEPHLGRVAHAFKGQKPIKAVLGRTLVFNVGDYDVVKVDIHSPELHEANAKLRSHVPMPGNEYNEYHPHATIAYVKAGKGAEYADYQDFEGLEVNLDKVTYSTRDTDAKAEIPLSKAANGYDAWNSLMAGFDKMAADIAKPFLANASGEDVKDFPSYLHAAKYINERTKGNGVIKCSKCGVQLQLCKCNLTPDEIMAEFYKNPETMTDIHIKIKEADAPENKETTMDKTASAEPISLYQEKLNNLKKVAASSNVNVSQYSIRLEKLKKTAAQTCDGECMGQIPNNISQDDLTAIANGTGNRLGYKSRLEAIKKKASGSGNYGDASIVCQSKDENKKKLDYKARLEAMRKRKDPDNIEKAASELTDINKKIKAAEAAVDTKPTEAQIKAGNYAKGHVSIQGLDITIENPKGSERSGISPDGKKWSTIMKNSYGYFGNTEGKDCDHVDVFLGDNPLSEIVYIVDQQDPSTGKFDEHKVMFGYDSEASAKAAYLANYEKNWKGFMSIKPMVMADFKVWVGDDGCWLLRAPSGARERKRPLAAWRP